MSLYLSTVSALFSAIPALNLLYSGLASTRYSPRMKRDILW